MNGKCIRHQVVKVGGNDDFVLCHGQQISQNRVAKTWVFALHFVLQKRVSCLWTVGEAARVNFRIEAPQIGQFKTFDTEIFCRSPLLKRKLIKVFRLMKLTQPFTGQFASGGDS